MTDNEALGAFNKYCETCRFNAATAGVKEEDILCDRCKVKNAIDALEAATSFDKLKELAKKFDCQLIKTAKPPKLLNCICGSNRRQHWYGHDSESLQCMRCGLTSPAGKNRVEVARNWNEMIEGLMKEGEPYEKQML